MPASVRQYLKEISAVGAEATEHSYRSPLEIFLKTLAGDAAKTRKTGKLTVLHEPSRKKYIGAPDFLILNNGGAAVGCVECKNPGDNLDALAGGAQVKKYAALSPNIILTDYYRFILLREGKIADDIKLTKKSGAKELQAAEELLHAFFAAEAQSIGDAKELAAALALRCAPLRDALVEILPDDKSKLSGLFKSFQQTIYRELDGAQFADALAQTLVYGLLMAKLKASDGEKLDLYNAEKHIPQNFALIGEIVGFLKELRRAEYQSVQYLTESVLAAVNAMDERAVADSMAYKKNTGGEDPYLNFYETFLAAYDAEMKKSRGVYYTPPSVARFIVRAADDILRRDFGLAKGLGDPKVTALDFAAGTGTFMLEMFRQIFGEASPAQRRALAREHLLKNFYGFEFLIAPYVIAHLKLSRFLEDNGAALQNGERVHVYLTNTLEQVSKQTAMDFMPALVEETATAQQIKNRDILVITGNPPYSAVSQNNGEWIKTLLRAYFQADGKPLGERNPRWLQDDYVKFIRFAQWKMEQINEGVVAIITNHAFLDNPTFRGMRESLLKTFNRLYFLDLHGNSNRQERAPDGGGDYNVFDIRQGVAVSVFVKNPGLVKGAYHCDFWGTRASKYKQCDEQSMESIKWTKIKPASPFYLFIPENKKLAKEFNKLWSVKDIFPVNSVSIITARDGLTLGFNKSEFQRRMAKFAAMAPESARAHFCLAADARDWKITFAQKDLQDDKLDKNKFCQIAYRPFDMRHTYYTGNSRGIHCKPRGDVMRHMRAGGNLGLVTVRQVAEKDFNHAFVADTIADFRMTLSNKGGAYLFPLYCYNNKMGGVVREENISPEFRLWLDRRYGKKHAPENILGYIYAMLYSPNYRRKYAELLRLEFPRIPFPQENAEFMRLAKIGRALIETHLLRGKAAGKTGLCREAQTLKVEKIFHSEKEKRLYFNQKEYFAPVSAEMYNYKIGGYRPLDKYLKSRKGRELTLAEIGVMEKAADAIALTIVQTKKIDG